MTEKPIESLYRLRCPRYPKGHHRAGNRGILFGGMKIACGAGPQRHADLLVSVERWRTSALTGQ